MCGICGVYLSENGWDMHPSIVKNMCDTITHRGPDDEGFYCNDHVFLGSRRLSIIDLENGNQPMSNEDQSIWLVFNGEIYNYPELRERLIQKGHAIRTHSDTEVIIHAYEEYGESFASELNGMFAFALWDGNRKQLLIARDRVGIKPLYYTHQRGRFVFASELKAIRVVPGLQLEIDSTAIDQFLTLEYIPGPRTIYKNVQKLSPGHYMVIREGQTRLCSYWEIPQQPINEPEEVCVEIVRGLLADAVKMQMISDVPIGAFLSGGIDSSAVVALMSQSASNPIRTFAIGFEDNSYNEIHYARRIAKQFHTLHHEEIIHPDIFQLIDQLVAHFDEPFADSSIFPTYLVSKMASNQVKVVLSGDGGDEVFGGYDTYLAHRLEHYYYSLIPKPLRMQALPAIMDRIPPRPSKKGWINKAKRMVEGGSYSPTLRHARWMVFMTDVFRNNLYKQSFRDSINGSLPVQAFLEHQFERASKLDFMAQSQYADIKTYLVDDILVKVDRMSMAASLEARVPLLDHRLIEFALNLPDPMRIRFRRTKVIFRKAMQGVLPPEIIEKHKQGFSIPIKHWLRGPLKPMMTDLLSPETIRRRGYFNPDTVALWMGEHLKGTVNHSHRLWALMTLELWHRKVMDGIEVKGAVIR
jgi:asparagine synthase (glutamine-hydrolysing)